MIVLLIELAWKSALVAGLALGLAALLRLRPATQRAAVLRVAVLALLALPILIAILPSLRVEAWTDPAPVAAPVAAPANPMTGATPAPRFAEAPASAPSVAPAVMVLGLYLLGVAALLLRLATGVGVLWRWTRSAREVEDPRWSRALRTLAGDRSAPRLIVSGKAPSPLSWGWPAVIMLSPEVAARPDRAEAVLAHELGHVRRLDWPFMTAARLLTAVFWFNPLIWILERELADLSEEAADAWATARVERLDYASALVDLAGCRGAQAAVGLGGPRGGLARRIAVLLREPRPSTPGWRAAVVASAGCVTFAMPVAALDLVARRTEAAVPRASAAIGAEADRGAAPRGAPGPASPPRPSARRRESASDAAPQPSASEASIGLASPGAPPHPGPPPPPPPPAPSGPLPAPVWSREEQLEAEERAREAAAAASEARQEAEMSDRDRRQTLREGAREMRNGAAEMERHVAEMERLANTTPADRDGLMEGAAHLRGQAADLRRRADELQRQAEGPP